VENFFSHYFLIMKLLFEVFVANRALKTYLQQYRI